MELRNRYDGIDDYAIQTIKYKARRLVGRAGFTESDREDLEQDFVLDLLRRLPRYNPDRATRKTFTARVVKHRIVSIIEERGAQKRDWRQRAPSLNEYLLDENGKAVERLETVSEEDYLRRTGRLSRPLAERRDLIAAVQKFMEQLPPKERDLCLRLMSGRVSWIARDTGIPRGTLNEAIRRLLARAKAVGLDDFI